jgi:hypothetical protein
MWLLTSIGFFSVVEKAGDKGNGTLTVRARIQDDLETLRDQYLPSLGPILKDVGTDYQFRATAPREDLSKAVSRLVSDIDYSNFKNAIAMRQGLKRESLYHRVWNVLAGL